MPLPLPVDPALQPDLARTVAEDLARGVAAAVAAGGAAPTQELTVGDTTVREYELLVDVPTGMKRLPGAVEPTGYHRVHVITVVRTHRDGDEPSRDRVEVLAVGRALLPDGSIDPARHETLVNFPALVAQAIAVSIDAALDSAQQDESGTEPDPPSAATDGAVPTAVPAAVRAAVRAAIDRAVGPRPE